MFILILFSSAINDQGYMVLAFVVLISDEGSGRCGARGGGRDETDAYDVASWSHFLTVLQ